MTGFVLPDVRQLVLDAIEIVYSDASDAQTLMASDLGVRDDTVRQWIHGRRTPSRGLIAQLEQILDEKMTKAVRFRARIAEALPAMRCPLCGGEIVVHHHGGGRTAKCAANPEHVFEPEPGPPYGNDTAKRFVQVVASTSRAPRVTAKIGAVPARIGFSGTPGPSPSKYWTEEDRLDLLRSLQEVCEAAGTAAGKVAIMGPFFAIEVPGLLQASQIGALDVWLRKEADRLRPVLTPDHVPMVEKPAQLGGQPVVVGRNPKSIIIELSRDVTPEDHHRFRHSFNAFTDRLGHERGTVTSGARRMQALLRDNLIGDQSRALREWFNAECDRIDREG